MKIFLINGPAGSGKDTAAEILKNEHAGIICKFAAPLKRAATAIYFGGDRNAFDEFDTFEKKGEPRPEFFGLSCRQVQINISENFLKPQHGTEVFGNILKEDIKRWVSLGETGPFFVSDSGFVPEAEVLVRAFGPESICLIRIHRPDFNFAGDSRGYVYLDHLGVNSFDVRNDSNLDVFTARLLEISNNLLGVDR